MPTPSTPPLDDVSRLDDLWALELLANTSEPEFENLTQLASEICDAPLAFISFMDQDRVWFKSRVGFDALHVPREHTFCTQAVQGTGPLVVEDATSDPRFQDNVYVKAPNGIRFYAGIPLVLSSGHAVGTLALVDHKARTLSDKQLGSLKKLAILAVALIEAKRTALRLQIEDRNRLLVEQRLDFALTSAEIGEWERDLLTGKTRRSLTHDRIFGYSEAVSEWSYEIFLSHVVEADRARVDAAYQRAKAGAGTVENEYRIVWPDGSTHWLWTRGRFHFDADGKLYKASGIVIDVTERKKSEENLRESEYRWRFAIEGSGDGLWDWDIQNNRVFYSDRWLAMLGLKNDAMEDDPQVWSSHLHPQDKDRVLTEVQSHLDAKTPQYANEHRVICKDGSTKWMLGRGLVVQRDSHGRPLRMIGTNSDITARKQAERDRDRIFNLSIDPIAVCGFDGYFKDVNPAWTTLLGWTAEELTARPWLEFIHPDDHEGTKQVKTDLDHDLPLLKFENRYRHKDGSYRWFSWKAYPLPDEQVILAVARDVTDAKQMELEIRSSLREKTALLKEVHHRVKNNLQVITSLLRLESHRSTVDQTKAVLGDMQARIRAMALLHESLYRTGTFASVDLGSYLRELSTQALRTQERHSGAVQLALNLGSVQVSMDQAIPCGLLINELISNCLKHAFPAGETGHIRIDLQPLDAQSQWCLRVSDTGVGLPENFEEKRQNSLGLQLVGDLAGQIGGVLTITPNQGKGVSFTVNFQAVEPVALVMPA